MGANCWIRRRIGGGLNSWCSDFRAPPHRSRRLPIAAAVAILIVVYPLFRAA